MEGELQRALGANVRAYRLQRSLSQEAFAETLGRHRTYVGAIERGELNMTLRTVERLADQLGQPAITLLAPPAPHPVGPPATRPAGGRARRRRA